MVAGRSNESYSIDTDFIFNLNFFAATEADAKSPGKKTRGVIPLGNSDLYVAQVRAARTLKYVAFYH